MQNFESIDEFESRIGIFKQEIHEATSKGCKEFIIEMDGWRVHKRKPVAIRGHLDSGVSPEETAIGWQIEVASHLTSELEPWFHTVAYSTKLKEKQPQLPTASFLQPRN